MKLFKVLIKTLIFIVGALASLWIFMPWGEMGEYAVLSAEKTASSRGYNIQHSSVSGSWIGPSILINDFASRMVLAGGEFKTLRLSPSFIQSLIRFSPVMSVSFTGGKLSLPGGNDADLGSGRVEISLKNGILLLNNLRSTGELSFDGFATININSARIENADIMINSPERIESSLNSMSIMLPLTRESAGQWRLKRDG